MPNHARTERRRLAELLEAAGPEAPTLCKGWTTADLAAHLVLRERRLDAAAGILLRALAGWTARVQRNYSQRPYGRLLAMFRGGPPAFSPFALPRVDEAANTVEYFVHAEDVRRAAPDWDPAGADRTDPDLAESLWKRLAPLTRFETAGKAPSGLVLRRPDGQSITVRGGEPVVTVVGEPEELVLFAFGRGARTRVTAEGEPDAVAALAEALPLP